MGYSATAAAIKVLNNLMEVLKADNKKHGIVNNQTNTWTFNGRMYFYEVGRENQDGAVTGTIQEIYNKGGKDYCKKAGSFRINPDGKIARFPGTSKPHRDFAVTAFFLRKN